MGREIRNVGKDTEILSKWLEKTSVRMLTLKM